jgi:two-component system, cell cycle sensor histidine kinase and response regulator CckA
MIVLPAEPAEGLPGRRTTPGELRLPNLIPAYVGNETLLLVEDEPMIREILSFALERYGYHVLIAKDGEDAERIADEYAAPIHIVLSDVVMPRRDGVSLCHEMRRWFPGIGVLLMSGYPDGEVAALALEDDHAFFIRKPFGIEQLVAAVRAALDRRPKHHPG